MTAVNLIENSLFKEWRNRRKHLVRDGACLDYWTTRPRILVVLKEVNDPGNLFFSDSFSLTDFLQQGARAKTWNMVCRWVSRIDNKRVLETFDDNTRSQILRTIATINLKKDPGSATSVRSEIHRYVDEDYDLLERQMLIYDPDYTIFGGTFEFIMDRDFFGKIKPRLGRILSLSHPASRKSIEKMISEIDDALAQPHSQEQG